MPSSSTSSSSDKSYDITIELESGNLELYEVQKPQQVADIAVQAKVAKETVKETDQELQDTDDIDTGDDDTGDGIALYVGQENVKCPLERFESQGRVRVRERASVCVKKKLHSVTISLQEGRHHVREGKERESKWRWCRWPKKARSNKLGNEESSAVDDMEKFFGAARKTFSDAAAVFREAAHDAAYDFRDNASRGFGLPKLVTSGASLTVAGCAAVGTLAITCEMISKMHAIEWARASSTPLAILLLDFKKAYDRVDWGFLEGSLSRMGFPQAWIRGVSALYRSASSSVTIGGHVGSRFELSRSVRQGCPLAPYLFLFVAEAMSDFIRVHQPALRGLLMPVSDEPELIDQEYADDTLLFLHYTLDVLDIIRFALERFCVASGARINWDKSYGILAGGVGCFTRAAVISCHAVYEEETVLLVDYTSFYGWPCVGGQRGSSCFSLVCGIMLDYAWRSDASVETIDQELPLWGFGWLL
ncbi:hypothetical protein L7F22_034616 [Adiantum nelumboides]|nr:hypothetical protein [Adiantum nelumboides]